MNKIWIIGASTMASEYCKVLQAQKEDFIVIGRSENSALTFHEKTGIKPFVGGVEKFLATNPEMPSHVIVAVGIEQLCPVADRLVDYGVKHILLEKPGGLFLSEMNDLANKAAQVGCRVFVAYNRRFYASVIEAEEIINQDGGVTSFNFEFTEWTHTIHPDHRPIEIFNRWMVANSSHVIDTAFFLCGEPKEMSCYKAGEGNIEWHPSGSVYVGAGISKKGALFSYQANWQAPGRWAVEILTRKHRLYLKPMETLQIQDIGSVRVNPVELDDTLDKEFKPGFYLQTKAFLSDNPNRLCTLEEQIRHIEDIYYQINPNYRQ